MSKHTVPRTALAFILPLIAFLVISTFYPNFDAFSDDDAPELKAQATFVYVCLIMLQVTVGSILLVSFRRIYAGQFSFRISPLAVGCGVVGVVLWITLCHWQVEKQIFQAIGIDLFAESRPAFNPFQEISNRVTRWSFLVFRFALLALLVPVIEELFLRGWLIRWIDDPDWATVRLDQLSWKALLVPSLYGMLTHPSEAIAAFVWFGLVTLMMKKTGNLWDCIMAHAVTNLLLGLYVIQFEAWHLW